MKRQGRLGTCLRAQCMAASVAANICSCNVAMATASSHPTSAAAAFASSEPLGPLPLVSAAVREARRGWKDSPGVSATASMGLAGESVLIGVTQPLQGAQRKGSGDLFSSNVAKLLGRDARGEMGHHSWLLEEAREETKEGKDTVIFRKPAEGPFGVRDLRARLLHREV